MASRTTKRQAKIDDACRINAISNRINTKLLCVRSALFVDQRVSMKTSRDQLIECWVGQHVTSDLLDRKLIKWQIAVERLNDPVAIDVCVWASAILFVAVRVREVRKV